ncbi:MAG: ATP-dependent sacrificial sulfur transferase LarE [Bacteroidales bacterium]|nr:ATP-dependent sacrificial sulfur transferase LarE [Bacteroidales bacterium]MBN2762785.1 ATP-dependent sacrificial sulfur transferase LarE [Bacteroidales bacterium]
MTTLDPYQDDYKRLLEYLRKLSQAAVAFSGGTDSTFLLWAAKEALGENVLALTVKTPYIPDWEIEEASLFCKRNNIRHQILTIPFPEIIRNNPEDRCYRCKKQLFERLLHEAAGSGITTVLDGTNADDMHDYRPGLRALSELEIKSPLLESGITKAVIRHLSKSIGLPTWDKPAYACLLTRLPYNRPVRENVLTLIEKAELFLMLADYRSVRVRVQDNAARIEMDNDLMPRFISSGFYKKTAVYFKSIGFQFISLDLEGYRKGSFNTTIEK